MYVLNRVGFPLIYNYWDKQLLDHRFVMVKGLANSVNLLAMLCRMTQDGWVMEKHSDKMWLTGGGNGKPLQYYCPENPMNSVRKQNDMTLEGEPHQNGKRPICRSRRVEGNY